MSNSRNLDCRFKPISSAEAPSAPRACRKITVLEAAAVGLGMARAKVVQGQAEHLRWGSELVFLQPVSARVSNVNTQLRAFFFIGLWGSLASKAANQLDKPGRLPATSRSSVSIITRGSAPTTISRGPMARKKLSREQYYSPQRIALVRARGYVLGGPLLVTSQTHLPETLVKAGSLPLPLHAYLVRMSARQQHPMAAAYGLRVSSRL
jgi:hypothetical protein